VVEGCAGSLPLIVQLCPAADGRTSHHWNGGRSLGAVPSRVAPLHPLSAQPRHSRGTGYFESICDYIKVFKYRENFVKKMANCSSPAGSVLGGAAHLAVMVAVMRGAILVQTVCTP
jgi:hypothetical protein